MRVLNRLDISGSFGLGSSDKDQFVIGSPDLENNDISTDNLKVWANADFKNNVTLGSNTTDIIDVSGTLVNHGGASLTGSFKGNASQLTNITASGIDNFAVDVRNKFSAGENISISIGIAPGIISATTQTSGNISGNGTSASPVVLKENIFLNSITASFSGSGEYINNITASNINNFSTDTRKQISGTGVISYNPSTGVITYTGVGGTIYTDGNVTGSGTSGDPIRTKDIITGSAFTASVGISASYYYGDGSNLTGLMTSVFTTGNVDGDGSSGNKIRLKDNISLTSVTASYFTGSSAKLNYLDFVGLSTPPVQDTAIVWQDETSYELRQWTEVPDVHIKLGQQIVTRAHNNTGVTISKGTVVHLTGANNQPVPRINPANWTEDYLSANTLGVTNNDILQGEEGYVVISGLIEGINTNGFNSGDILYLSGSGGISNVKAVAPNHLVIVGQVVRNGNSSVGSIFVKVQNGYEIDELHNVLITGSSNYDLLMLDTDGIWKNTKTLAGNYTFSGNNQFTGSLNGTASYASNADLFDGQDSSLFALKTDVTGAIANFPTRAEVTGALSSYLTTATAASTYATLTGVSSSFAQQNTAVTFTQVTASTGFSGGTFTGTTVSASTGLTGSNLHIVSQAEFDGGVKIAYSAKTNNYTLTASSDYVVSFSGSALTGTLPNAANIQGTVLVIKNLHTSSIFVTSSTARIDGSTTGVFINGQYTSYTFLSDNTNWLII